MSSEVATSISLGKTRGIASTEDDLNRAIIKMLRQDGRLTYKDIATKLKVSEGTIRNRVQSMKQSGALKIVALADPMADMDDEDTSSVAAANEAIKGKNLNS